MIICRNSLLEKVVDLPKKCIMFGCNNQGKGDLICMLWWLMIIFELLSKQHCVYCLFKKGGHFGQGLDGNELLLRRETMSSDPIPLANVVQKYAFRAILITKITHLEPKENIWLLQTKIKFASLIQNKFSLAQLCQFLPPTC